MLWHSNVFPYYIKSEKWWVESGYSPCEWVSDSIHNSILEWLMNSINQDDWQIHSRDREIYGIRFKNVEDMVAFKLMWYR